MNVGRHLTLLARQQAYADGLFSVRWNAGLGTPEALVFSADARGRGEHLVGPAQRARQREANRCASEKMDRYWTDIGVC
jgi:hypothetical protein